MELNLPGIEFNVILADSSCSLLKSLFSPETPALLFITKLVEGRAHMCRIETSAVIVHN